MYVLDDWVKNTKLTNVYDIYRDFDYDIDLATLGYTTIDGKPATYKRGYSAAEYAPWLSKLYGKDWTGPILGYTVSDYLNKPEVRKLLHISAKVGTWSACTNNPNWVYHLQLEGSKYIYDLLKWAGIKILVYSGDTDLMVNTLGTIKWIDSLGWPVKKEWRQWNLKDSDHFEQQQVCGWKKEYEGMTFQTIHGVGHMAPQWKRRESLQMLNDFIYGE